MRESAGEQRCIPARPVLLSEQHRISARPGTGGRACVMETDEGGERMCLAGRGARMLTEKRHQSQCLCATLLCDELRALGCRVAACEQLVNGVQESGQPPGELRSFRNLDGELQVAEATFGAHQSLSDGLRGRKECAGYLPRVEPTDRLQRQHGLFFV